MNAAVELLAIAICLLVIDLPWLLFQGSWVKDIIQDIQGGRSMQMRMWGGIPVYIALAYLLTQAKSAPRAFLLGLCTYAVYDFTQIFTFDHYPLEFAVLDSLWGGFLMAIAWLIVNSYHTN